MSWWMIVLIVLAALVLIAVVVANVELDMFLAPNGFFGKKFRFKEVKDIQDTQSEENSLGETAASVVDKWLSKSNVKDIWTISFDTYKLHSLCVLQARESHKWAVCLHGYGGNYLTAESIAKEYFSKGYNALIPDLRYYGKSQGRFAGMGWLDRKDVLEWIHEILKMDPQAEIVVHGVSMGGATVMMLSGEQLPESVKCLVEDCGYTSVWNVFRHIRKTNLHLPVYPMLPVCGFFCLLRNGFMLRQASSLKQLKKCQKPIFFIHGAEDDFVPCHMILENYYAVQNAPKDWFVMAGAAHAVSVYQDSDLYWRKVFGFVERYVK